MYIKYKMKCDHSKRNKSGGNRTKRNRTSKRMRGGDGAGYALNVFGNASQQHAAVGNGNVISMNNAGCQSGGKKKQRKNQKGGFVIPYMTNVAVPAFLLTSNELYKRRTQKRKSPKN